MTGDGGGVSCGSGGGLLGALQAAIPLETLPSTGAVLLRPVHGGGGSSSLGSGGGRPAAPRGVGGAPAGRWAGGGGGDSSSCGSSGGGCGGCAIDGLPLDAGVVVVLQLLAAPAGEVGTEFTAAA